MEYHDFTPVRIWNDLLVNLHLVKLVDITPVSQCGETKVRIKILPDEIYSQTFSTFDAAQNDFNRIQKLLEVASGNSSITS